MEGSPTPSTDGLHRPVKCAQAASKDLETHQQQSDLFPIQYALWMWLSYVITAFVYNIVSRQRWTLFTKTDRLDSIVITL